MTQVLSTDCKTNRLSVLEAKDMEEVFAIVFLQRRPSKVVMNEFDYRHWRTLWVMLILPRRLSLECLSQSGNTSVA